MSRILAPALLLLALLPLAGTLLAGGSWSGTAAALGRSLLVAGLATVLAVPLGLMAGVGLRRAFRGRAVLLSLLALPVLLPPAVAAGALGLVVSDEGAEAGLPGLVLWHAALAAPLVAALALHATAGLQLPRAVQACGVPPAMLVGRLLRPRLGHAARLGAGLAFALSLGESSLAALSGVATLPATLLAGGAGSPLLPAIVAVALAAALTTRGPVP